MTRKDYILIAMAIADARRAIKANDTADADTIVAMVVGVRAVTANLATALARDNARFDRARFIAACEVQS